MALELRCTRKDHHPAYQHQRSLRPSGLLSLEIESQEAAVAPVALQYLSDPASKHHPQNTARLCPRETI